MKYVAAAVLSLFLFSLAFAQTLWGGTSSGMSVQEVLATVPGAVESSGSDNLGNGALNLVSLDEIEVLSIPFEARFYFGDDGLEQVNLRVKDSGSAFSELTRFETLATGLRARYGPELSYEVDNYGVGLIAKATWLSDGTNIELTLIGVGNSPAIFGISYQTRLSREIENL